MLLFDQIGKVVSMHGAERACDQPYLRGGGAIIAPILCVSLKARGAAVSL
jgi:hypothetical protein